MRDATRKPARVRKDKVAYDTDDTALSFETARSKAYKKRMGDLDRALGRNDTRGCALAARVARQSLREKPASARAVLRLDDRARASAARSIALADGSDICLLFQGPEP